MIIKPFSTSGLAITSYIVADQATKTAAIIDPTRAVDPYLSFLKEHRLTLTHILETHVHADFVSGACELKRRLGGVPQICSSAEGGPEWLADYADRAIKDKEQVELGNITLQAFYTPGHTPEHICWLLYDFSRSERDPVALFSGDFLFVGSVGRPDLLGEEQQQKLIESLYQSLFQKLPALPDFIEIYPSHGSGSLCGKSMGAKASTTLGFERRYSPSLIEQPIEQWTDALMKDMPAAPPYFQRMKRINKIGPELLPSTSPHEISPAELLCHPDWVVIDLRNKEAFAGAHLPSSISLPKGPSMLHWAGWLLSYDTPYLLLGNSQNEVMDAQRQLQLIGFDHIEGVATQGITPWEQEGYSLESLPILSVTELAEQQAADDSSSLLIDVRNSNEWDAGHIAGAMHIPLNELLSRSHEIPKEKKIRLICGSGYRSTIAASLLEREGFHHLENIAGGMTAWKQLESKKSSLSQFS